MGVGGCRACTLIEFWGGDGKDMDRKSPPQLVTDPTRVLVVGKSPVNRIVVSKIVERCGLRPVSETPGDAERTLKMLVPAAIVLDGGADNMDCNALMAGIASMRRASGKASPSVILLSIRNGAAEDLALSGIVDAVIAKPITTEKLQPAIERLVSVIRV